MDKLQPILKHHFWILSFLVLPLAIWGYYSANSSLNAATQVREDALNTAISAIPSGNSPNKTWETEMKVLADGYEIEVNDVIVALHEGQESRMDWPQLMAAAQPDTYRGAWNINLQAAYGDEYTELMREVWERYQPVATDIPEGGDRSRVTWDEKVLIEPEVIQPLHLFGNLRATDEQIWDAQEDIWLHRLIADAVVRTNEDADGPYTSIVKMVQQVELMGGDGKPVAAGGGQGNESAGSNIGAADNAPQGYGGGRGGRRGTTQSLVAFDPAEEIGTGGRSAARGRGTGYGGMNTPSPAGGPTEGADETSGSTGVLRYVGASQTGEARVRAFYMSVIVDQEKFPEFLVELCNSEWPIEIVRFNIGQNPYYASAQPSGRQGIMNGGGYSGPMGGYGGPMGGYGGPMGNRPMSGSRTPMSSTPMGRPMGGPSGMGGGTPPMGMDSAGRRQSHESFGALENSNLVQLDLLGLITIFNPSDRPAEAASSTTAAGTVDETSSEADVSAEEDVSVEAATTDTDVESETVEPQVEDSSTEELAPMDEPTEPVDSAVESADESGVDVDETESADADSSQSSGNADSQETTEPETSSDSEEVPAVE